MKNGFFLITGTSKGIGEAVAQKILQEGHTVLGISRNRSDLLTSPNYHHLSIDLTDTSRFNQILEQTNKIVEGQPFDFLCLINNASATEPMGPIEACPPEAIEAHVKIGLVAPMLLTSLFIKRFQDEKVRKKVVFISSGAALHPLADMSVYCGSKAGSLMFGKVIGAEQKDKEYGFEVVSIGPGMVETGMQQAVRSKSDVDFAMSGYFRQAYEEGKVQEPELVAEKIFTILQNTYEQGQYVSVSEI
ncbi:MAG: SDR family NAD(P)-dependent oxidoreductase [Bacteroidales bacterium]|nr:SDR family NAD(P)-dependent oxidoreductase [Bacteroidales bacterium]